MAVKGNLSVQRLAKTLPPKQIYEEYERSQFTESLGSYCKGGFHPTHIDEEFAEGRYKIIHKLGHGTFSTVWLARDRTEGRYVALKIVRSGNSTDCPESRILRQLQQGDIDHPGRQFVPTLLDDFWLDGPNGRHLCLVSEPAGGTVAASKERAVGSLFPLDVARSIAANTAMGLAYVHACGVGHGDLYPSNILLQISNFDALSVEQIYERYGKPERVPVRRCDKKPLGKGIPAYTVVQADIVQPCSQVRDGRIKISDFGHAYKLTNPPKMTPIECEYCAPEIKLEEKPDAPADVWALACTVYEILGTRRLFLSCGKYQEDVFEDIVDALGIFPDTWWNSWPRRDQHFTEDGLKLKGSPRSMKVRIQEMGRGTTADDPDFSAGEKSALEQLLHSMLKYEPSERISAQEVLQSTLMLSWSSSISK
ncbi:MAG: hypothetical protein M1836_003327 [Candelina mexicana]|nr:MAG: hypothetical protein M1836_003327 [Candelina mexicana]